MTTSIKELYTKARQNSSPFGIHDGVGAVLFEDKFAELLLLEVLIAFTTTDEDNNVIINKLENHFSVKLGRS